MIYFPTGRLSFRDAGVSPLSDFGKYAVYKHRFKNRPPQFLRDDGHLHQVSLKRGDFTRVGVFEI